MSQLLRTPLFPLYEQYPNVRCIDFGGWELPVSFSGIQKEHEAVRQQAGLFDVSHMGEFRVEGENAANFLQGMLTNDISLLEIGQAQYTLMCYPTGGVVDDLLVYKRSEHLFMLVVNASNIDKDWTWLQEHLPANVQMVNESNATALLALQGPKAEAILSKVTDVNLAELGSFRFVDGAEVSGSTVILSRTGYTGEDGFEIYVSADDAQKVWLALMAAGEDEGLLPIGLGARDTLRFEAKLPLYGQELSSTITPLEAGLGMFVKLAAGDFIGRDALVKQKEEGLTRKLVGIEITDRGIPRAHYPVFADEEQIGEVTTGTQSPTLKRNLGLALLDIRFTEPGTTVDVEIRGKRLKAEVIKTPFYRRPKPTAQAAKGANS